MKSRLVYRAETPETGHGPFDIWLADEFSEAMGVDGYHNGDAHPTPHEEGIEYLGPCGCISPRQFIHWFPRPCREVLREHGFVLSVYEVPEAHVAIGERQVTFCKADARLITQRPI